jgi:hypothetical protein
VHDVIELNLKMQNSTVIFQSTIAGNCNAQSQ